MSLLSPAVPDANSAADSATRLTKLATHFTAIELSLRQDFHDLLHDLGNPHHKLPPTIHLAGTNGKGSTAAFLCAICEAANLKTHVYTSPHLVHFHERIRLAGSDITEKYLTEILQRIEVKLAKRTLTQFEIATLAAFIAFAEIPADILILETGMGGRLDATNIIPKAIASIITPISFDHQSFLGNTLAAIASEKAGIIKTNTPVILSPQTDTDLITLFAEKAQAHHAPLFTHGRDWHYAITPNGFSYTDKMGTLNLPAPSLLGAHQYANAATAIAALRHQTACPIPHNAFEIGVKNAHWPARLQRLTHGPLFQHISKNCDVWLDGAHNISGASILAQQCAAWAGKDNAPLFVIFAMLTTKNPDDFLRLLSPHITGLAAIPIAGADNAHTPHHLATAAKKAGISLVFSENDLISAAKTLPLTANKPARLLITGSLYLAGQIVAEHG